MNAITREQLQALGADMYPDVAAMKEEQRELFRLTAQRSVDMADAGQYVEPHHLAWCRQFVAANKPLGRALSTGEPK